MLLLLNISNDMPLFAKISFIFGGVAIFLYGIHIMGNALQNLAGNKLKMIIEKTTNTVLKGILTGAVMTAIIQSSSGTTAIVVALISAGLMTFPQGVSVIMGANIGTTITSIIIGLNISEYSLIIIGVGAIIAAFCKKQKLTDTGLAILGFGLLFFGLEMMGDTLKLFANEPAFTNLFLTLSKNPILGVFVGAGVTAIIQSSSAAIGIVQKLYSGTSGGILLTAAIPIILGSNIGTTVTAVISSVNSTRAAKRAALFHVIFNVIGTLFFLILLSPYTKLMYWIEGTFFKPFSSSTLAVAHVIFNFVTTFSIAFFVKYLIKFIEHIIKPSEEEKMISSIDKLNYSLLDRAPVLAIENAHHVIMDMSVIVEKMYDDVTEYMFTNNPKLSESVKNYEDLLDNYDAKIHDYLTQLSSKNLDYNASIAHTIHFDTIRDFERIGDHLVNITEFMDARHSTKIEFEGENLENIKNMLKHITLMVKDSLLAYRTGDKSASRRVISTEPQIDELEKKYRKANTKALANGTITYNNVHFVDILANLERIGDHTNNVAENILNNSIHNLN